MIATKEQAGTPTATPIVYPQVDFPEDAALPEIPKLFDGNWLWQASSKLFQDLNPAPGRFRIRQFGHIPGRSALVSYFVDWDPETFIPTEIVNCRLTKGIPPEFSRYPQDRQLPGLEQAAIPGPALDLLNKHAFAFPRRRLRVNMIRYRPGSRAVLRHRTGGIKLYARVLRPSALPNLLEAYELLGHSGFAVPRIIGSWGEGGVVWMSEIPGTNVRRLMRCGQPPNPTRILESLEGLWSGPPSPSRRSFDLGAAFRRAERTFRHALGNHDAAQQLLDRVILELDPFVRSWQPSTNAHNDFYDEQVLELPDGRLAVVDFEETGPGDPMLDIGNFLAHLLWTSKLGRSRKMDVSDSFYDQLRTAALDRFNWNSSDLNLREAVCLFRITTNTVRRPSESWLDRTMASFKLVVNCLN